MNKVIHGDCLEVMANIPDKSVDMILADLPYGQLGTTACKWDTIIPFEPLWKQYERIIKDNGAIVLTARNPFSSALVMSKPKLYKHKWVWNKRQSGSPHNAKYMPLQIEEDILVFARGRVNYYPMMRKGKMRRKGGNKSNNRTMNDGLDKHPGVMSDLYFPVNIIEITNPRLNKRHPTEKPVSLFEYLIKTYTTEGDTILDNCAGSGTTAIACMNTNRNYILIEKEQEYIDIIHKRIEAHKAVLYDNE